MNESGLYIAGNGKSIATIIRNNKLGIIATQNRDYVKLFSLKNNVSKSIKWAKNDQYCLIHFKNGRVRKEESTLSNVFLSQSGNHVLLNHKIAKIEFINNAGQKRVELF